MPVSNTVHDLYLSASSLLFKSHLCPSSYPWIPVRVLLNKRLYTSSSAHWTLLIPRPVNRGNRHLFLTQSTDSYRESTSLMRTLHLTVCCNKTFFFLQLAELKRGFCEDSTYESVRSEGFHNMTCLISVADPDLQIRGRRSFRPWDKGGAQSQKNFFSARRASIWSKNKGGRAPRAPALDPPLNMDTPLVWTLIPPSAQCPL